MGVFHPLTLILVLNPAIAPFEIGGGMALPKELYVCQSCDVPYMDRTYLYCSQCDTLYDSRRYLAKGGTFGYWYGYLCPTCQRIIPRVWSLFALFVLGVTLPIWWIPAKLLRRKWSNYKLVKLNSTLSKEPVKYEDIKWVAFGVIGAGIVWAAGRLAWIVSLYYNGSVVQFDPILLFELFGYLLGGAIFGFIVKIVMGKKGKDLGSHRPYSLF